MVEFHLDLHPKRLTTLPQTIRTLTLAHKLQKTYISKIQKHATSAANNLGQVIREEQRTSYWPPTYSTVDIDTEDARYLTLKPSQRGQLPHSHMQDDAWQLKTQLEHLGFVMEWEKSDENRVFMVLRDGLVPERVERSRRKDWFLPFNICLFCFTGP